MQRDSWAFTAYRKIRKVKSGVEATRGQDQTVTLVNELLHSPISLFIHLTVMYDKYSRTPLIRKLVIRIANYPDRLGPSSKRTLTLQLFIA